MASLSPRALAVLYGFSVLFCCLPLIGAATKALVSPWSLERLAATTFFPSVLVTMVVTPLLSFAHVEAIGGGGAAGDRRRLVTAGLAKVTVLASTLALVASTVLLLGADGIVVQLGADGHLDRGRGDVARLNIK